MKLEFDIAQLRYVIFQYPNSAKFVSEVVLFAYQKLLDYVKSKSLGTSASPRKVSISVWICTMVFILSLGGSK